MTITTTTDKCGAAMRENYRLKSQSGEISFSLRVLASFPFGRSSPALPFSCERVSV